MELRIGQLVYTPTGRGIVVRVLPDQQFLIRLLVEPVELIFPAWELFSVSKLTLQATARPRRLLSA